MIQDWVPHQQFLELIGGKEQRGPPVHAATAHVPGMVRFRPIRCIPRRRSSDWSAYEYNLDDVNAWLAKRAAELLSPPREFKREEQDE